MQKTSTQEMLSNVKTEDEDGDGRWEEKDEIN